jgi:ubiquitin-protein ligase
MSLGSNPARVIRRIEKELQNLRRDPIDGCSAQPKDARNLFEWIASIQGPPYSPYAGGIFHMDIRFPNDYPLKPPTVTFVTKICTCHVFVRY